LGVSALPGSVLSGGGGNTNEVNGDSVALVVFGFLVSILRRSRVGDNN